MMRALVSTSGILASIAWAKYSLLKQLDPLVENLHTIAELAAEPSAGCLEGTRLLGDPGAPNSPK